MDDLFMRGKCHGSLVALGVERWFDGESDPPLPPSPPTCTFQAPQRSCLIMDFGPNPDTFMFSGKGTYLTHRLSQ